jgi:3-deoxy-D-manno-octulosonate 8-phosphate phosphatase (KDO 8-P phosphatase)
MEREEIRKAKDVRLLILDVDGVLTDGKIIYTDGGEEIKSFNVKDGHGLKLLMRAGIEVAVITGRRSRVVEHRCKDLGISCVFQGCKDKIEAYHRLLKEKNLTDDEVGFVGDDLTDIPVLERVGFSATVADGTEEVKQRVHYVARAKGGEGAVREICEAICKLQNKWDEVTQRYFTSG